MDRQFAIRPAALSDAAPLAHFAAEQFRATYGADTPAADLEAYLSTNFTPEQQSRDIADPSSQILVATSDGAIIGYAHVRFEADTSAFLNRIYVAPSWKGKALGSALLAEVIDKAGTRGAERIRLTVYEKNARAVAFYLKSGFSVVGTDIFLVGDDRQTDLVMERLLA